MSKLHVNNAVLYYEINGQGEPLLFIHGLASSSRSWGKQVPQLSKHYQVITFDMRGHGRSGKPLGSYTVELFAADTAALMRSLGINSAHIVGFSLGGMVGFQLAVDAPEMVKSLVAVNCCPEGSVRTFNDGIDCFKHLALVQFNGMRKRRNGTGQQLLPSPSDQGQLNQSIIERLAMNNKLVYASAFCSLVSWSVANRLQAISCPTLLVTSDQDFIPVSIKQDYVSRMPRAEIAVIDDSGHGTPRERAEEFNAILMEFLFRHSHPAHACQSTTSRTG